MTRHNCSDGQARNASARRGACATRQDELETPGALNSSRLCASRHLALRRAAHLPPAPAARRARTAWGKQQALGLEEFVEGAEEAGGLPEFVRKEVREYLRCGLLEYGLLHCRCSRCGHDQVCAFSCKRRGSCPSCLGRRMTDTALDLVERVLPEGVPVRQWVCSLPWRLRVLCGYDSALCADVMKAFEKEVSRLLCHRAKEQLGLGSVKEAHTDSVLFIQRFDSAIRLNVHGHLLSLDGVYVRTADGKLCFHEPPEPAAEDVAEVARRTAARLVKVLKKPGRAESPALRLVDPSLARPHEPVAIAYGVKVHAAVRVHGNDRVQLQRLCRYLGRPPIAEERLTRTDDGAVILRCARKWFRNHRRLWVTRCSTTTMGSLRCSSAEVMTTKTRGPA